MVFGIGRAGSPVACRVAVPVADEVRRRGTAVGPPLRLRVLSKGGRAAVWSVCAAGLSGAVGLTDLGRNDSVASRLGQTV